MKCHNKHKSAGTLHSPQPSTNIFCPLPTPQLPKPQTPKKGLKQDLHLTILQHLQAHWLSH